MQEVDTGSGAAQGLGANGGHFCASSATARQTGHGVRVAMAARRYPWYVRLVLAAQRRKYGRELGPALLWGRLPGSLLALTLLYRSLDRGTSPIVPGLRALLQVRVSQINGCAFCVDLNSAAALEREVTHERLAALADFEHSPLFGEREKAALAYAEAMTDTRRGVDEPLFDRLRQVFSDAEIIELTALLAFQNLSSKFNSALGVPAPGLCTRPVVEEDP